MDNLLLHALAKRQKFSSLRHAVPQGDLIGQDTLALLGWFQAYYNAFPERDVIDWDELQSLVRLRAGNVPAESLALTMHLIDSLRNPPDETGVNGILGQLYELDLSGRSAALISRYQAGEEIDLAYELQKLAQGAVRAKAAANPSDYITTHIEDILSEIADDAGLKFRRLTALYNHIAGLQGGASIAIAARPDKGKTSLISDILTDFAPQVVQMYGDKRPILWLNNEGNGKRIKPRLYQAALGMTLDEIIALSNRGELYNAYLEATGGVHDLIRIKDVHGSSLAQIEQVLEEQRPAVCVADMLANVRISGSAGANKADAVEQLWQEWRELMVRHDCIGLATVQISVEGGNMPYPPYSALKDSKTGIQGATDVILMLGSLDNPDAQAMRWLSSPKNKFAIAGKPSCFQAELVFEASRCRFKDGAGAPQAAVAAVINGQLETPAVGAQQ